MANSSSTVSRVTTSHSVGQTIQSSRIGGTRRCKQAIHGEEHYSFTSTCSFSALKFAGDSNKALLLRVRRWRRARKKAAITRRQNFRLGHFHLLLHRAENFCQRSHTFRKRRNFISPHATAITLFADARNAFSRQVSSSEYESTRDISQLSSALDLIFFFFHLFLPPRELYSKIKSLQ